MRGRERTDLFRQESDKIMVRVLRSILIAASLAAYASTTPTGPRVGAALPSGLSGQPDESGRLMHGDGSVGDAGGAGSSGGSLLWKTQVSNVTNPDEGVTLGVVWSSPLLIGDTVYVGSRDSFLYALDRMSGEFVWMKDTTGYIDSSPRLVQWRG